MSDARVYIYEQLSSVIGLSNYSQKIFWVWNIVPPVPVVIREEELISAGDDLQDRQSKSLFIVWVYIQRHRNQTLWQCNAIRLVIYPMFKTPAYPLRIESITINSYMFKAWSSQMRHEPAMVKPSTNKLLCHSLVIMTLLYLELHTQMSLLVQV